VQCGVLNDQAPQSFWVREDESHSDVGTVVLNVEVVAREAKRLGEVVHDGGEVVEGVCGGRRSRTVTVTESD